MTALSASSPRTFVGDKTIERLPADVGNKIWAGATLFWDESNGGVDRYGGTAGAFAGFAQETVDNTAGALGDILLDVVRKGTVVLVLSATVALTNVGDTVYAAADDDTFNLTSTSNMAIGKITRVVTAGLTGANEVEVAFEASGFTSV